MQSLKNRFLEFVLKNDLIHSGEKVLLAVSGGVDSMVLLQLMLSWRQRLKIEVGVVHLNHGIRGEAADRDEELVAHRCRTLGVPFFGLRQSVPQYAAEHNLTMEEAGHRLREKLFGEVAEEQRYDKIATGHHQDDQAETVLMRLLRGSGLQGLAGIRLKKGCWIRPLLFATRKDIQDYAEKNQIPFCLDRSNLDTRILRNKIRLELLPLLQNQYNPGVSRHLNDLAAVLREWDDYIENECKKALESGILRVFKNKIHLDTTRFNLYFSWLKIRLLDHILALLSKEKSISFNQFSNFIFWIDRGKNGSEFVWGGGVRSYKADAHIVFYREDQLWEAERIIEIEEGKWCRLGNSGKEVMLQPADVAQFHKSANREEEFLDGAGLKFPLKARVWKPGDRFQPLGMSNTRLVSDFLTDCKVEQPDRHNVFVLLNNEEIVAILGMQISHRYRVKEDTDKIYRLMIRMT
ncbi:MAG: tRNA lysidine(34) synthetase TilS [Calditrichia bacterium]